MSAGWQSILGEDGSADGVNVIAQSLTDPALAALPDYAVFDAMGTDAPSFLTLQFCNDLALVSSTQAQLSGYCNPKGRLLSVFTVFAVEGGYRFVVHRDLLDGMIKRLQALVSLPIRDPKNPTVVKRTDVTLTPREDLLCSGVILPNLSAQALPGGELPTLAGDMAVQTDGESSWVRVSDTQRLFIASSSSQQSVWGSAVDKASSATWRLHTIQAGIPSLVAATFEQFVPQMLNLQQAGGLSFKHGCYPGQEIVARMQYLGKLKRQMLRYVGDGANVPAAGDSIATAEDADAGVVVDAVATADGIQLLAVMKLAVADEPLTVLGQALTKQALPYKFEIATSE